MAEFRKLKGFGVQSDNEGCGELILDFDNDRHHSCIFKKGDSRDLVIQNLRLLADNLEHDPNLNNNELPSKKKAPWPDYEGNDIYEGDVIEHPSGECGTVVLLEKDADWAPNYEWKVDYGDGYLLWLGLQISDKGMAVRKVP